MIEKIASSVAEKVLTHGCQVRPDCRWCKEAQRIVALLDALDETRVIPPGVGS